MTQLATADPAALAQQLIDDAELRDKRKLAARRSAEQVTMSPRAKALFDQLREEIVQLGDVIEVASAKSVSYHAPNFFVEIVPRKYELLLVLPVELAEVDDPDEIAEDADGWKFIPNATSEGGTVVRVSQTRHIASAMPMIRQALNTAAR